MQRSPSTSSASNVQGTSSSSSASTPASLAPQNCDPFVSIEEPVNSSAAVPNTPTSIAWGESKKKREVRFVEKVTTELVEQKNVEIAEGGNVIALIRDDIKLLQEIYLKMQIQVDKVLKASQVANKDEDSDETQDMVSV